MASQEQLKKWIDNPNIANDLDEDKLIEIGCDVVDGFEADKKSRFQWEQDTRKWMDLALQMSTRKTYPWQDASNVKFPLISIAAMQFSARAYPSLVPQNGNVVHCRVVGSDPQEEKAKRAIRLSKHMSYQIMEEMDEWEEDMDKLLLVMAITGIAFKKVYFDKAKDRNVSKLVYAEDLVVNNWTRNLADAERITEMLYYSPRKVKEMQLQKFYREVDLGEPRAPDRQTDKDTLSSGVADETTPHTILEQHTFIDLDDDGYAEPYIVTVDLQSKEVLRIVACYSETGVSINEQNEVVKITPNSYYVKYGAIPNPTGSFYNIGFGHLLGPLNESANTIINQLIDSGSLSNLQSGFIGKGLRMKMGDSKFRPGEWKAVNATGDDIKKQIFPMPVREPSGILFQLLGMLLTSGKELASVADIMVGKMPGQNTPAYTTKETVEQGMKLFTAIYKRVYRSLKEEFRKLYILNRTYLDPQVEIDILDEPIQQSDYKGSENDIIPTADPSAASSTERMAKVQEIFPLMQLGTLDPLELTKRALEAQEQPNLEKLIKQPSPPPPDPKMEALKAKAEIDGQKAQMDMAKGQQDLHIKQVLAQLEMQSKAFDLKIKQMEAMIDMKAKQESVKIDTVANVTGLLTEQQKHEQKMQHDKEMFTLKAIEQKKKAEAKAQPQVREPGQPRPPKNK